MWIASIPSSVIRNVLLLLEYLVSIVAERPGHVEIYLALEAA